ncbi:ATP-binding protein [Clostridium sp. WILCCON 0269]|uniref:histidine kinase n=1 Tax=Candidatus Clostridium eludens TaxID=3381663 RepID=A0ABW8SL31_9CLOT
MKIRFKNALKTSFKKIYRIIWNKLDIGIRLELILIFALCLIAAFAIGKVSGLFLQNRNMTARIDYSKGIERISLSMNSIADEIKNKNMSINDKAKVQKIINDYGYSDMEKIIITDLDGKVLYKSNNAEETQIDVYTTIKNSIKNSLEMMKNIQNIHKNAENIISQNKEYISFYPIDFSDGKAYLVLTAIPEYEIVYEKNYNPISGIIISLAAFLVMFYFATNKKMRYIENISSGLIEISKGNLHHKIRIEGHDELTSLAKHINFMAEELNNKIKHEREQERMKNELITNVSHDLRTPLTSIKGYLGLIKDRKYEDEYQLEQYINIAYSKSEKLDILINDLFEYTKLKNNAVSLNKNNISLNGLLEQLIEELVPICEENSVTISKDFPKYKFIVNVDPGKTVRIFENLFMNAIRYCVKPGNVKVSLKKQGECVVTSIQNKCHPINEEEVNKLFDRFYRFDKSRSSYSGGSGLGLSIAKSIVELQGGTIKADYMEENITFNVVFKQI